MNKQCSSVQPGNPIGNDKTDECSEKIKVEELPNSKNNKEKRQRCIESL
ncbi:MAG: hypothetical protein WHV26_15110 [Spirochaetota bacterium]